ncbi:MAG: hypothetical protein WBQ17_12195 [Rhizomicrobium sp.]
MSGKSVEICGLSVARELFDFIVDEAIPETGIHADVWWAQIAQLLHDFVPRNRALLARRDALQAKLDKWNGAHGDSNRTVEFIEAQRKFLAEIGYLLPEGPDFVIKTENVDPEVSTLAGPQLVVPLSNIRYVLNAVNARWGSLYDALYGQMQSPTKPAPNEAAITIRHAARKS